MGLAELVVVLSSEHSSEQGELVELLEVSGIALVGGCHALVGEPGSCDDCCSGLRLVVWLSIPKGIARQVSGGWLGLANRVSC